MKKKLASHLNIHAKRRMKERYGVELNKALRRQIIQAIQSGSTLKARIVCKQSLTRCVYDVRVGDAAYRVVYNSKFKTLATVLGLDMAVGPTNLLGTTEEARRFYELQDKIGRHSAEVATTFNGD